MKTKILFLAVIGTMMVGCSKEVAPTRKSASIIIEVTTICVDFDTVSGKYLQPIGLSTVILERMDPYLYGDGYLEPPVPKSHAFAGFEKDFYSSDSSGKKIYMQNVKGSTFMTKKLFVLDDDHPDIENSNAHFELKTGYSAKRAIRSSLYVYAELPDGRYFIFPLDDQTEDRCLRSHVTYEDFTTGKGVPLALRNGLN